MYVLMSDAQGTRLYVANRCRPDISAVAYNYTCDLQKAEIFYSAIAALSFMQHQVRENVKDDLCVSGNSSLCLVRIEELPPSKAQVMIKEVLL